MLHYEIIESKKENAPWMTFIHGIGVGSDIWEKQKIFSENFNLLFIDLPGHGNSPVGLKDINNPNFDYLAIEIDKILEKNDIESSVFVSLSLGTLVTQTFAIINPHKVSDMILCGAIEGFSGVARLFLKIFPYVKWMFNFGFVYTIASYFLLPGKKHNESRKYFVGHFKKIGIDEFVAWYNMQYSAIYWMSLFRKNALINKLYIMGRGDRMFLSSVRNGVTFNNHTRIEIIKEAGHVCNVDEPDKFNEVINRYFKLKNIVL